MDLRRAGPVECAVAHLGLAGVVALGRGWPPDAWYLLLLLLASAPFVVQLVRRSFLSTLSYALPVLTAEAAMAASAPHGDAAPLLLLSLVTVVALNDRARAAAVVTVAAIGIVVVADVAAHADGALLWAVGLSMTFLAGSAIRTLESTLAALELAQAELAARAAAEERRRVAREVHDVVAHTLAVTMLHLTGARLALTDGDTAEAESGLLEAERLGRESLVGLRRSVGLLTRDEAGTAPPAPGLGTLRQLVDEYAAGGLDVALASSTRARLPDDVGLAVHRIVQESLANAVRHSPGSRVEVVVRAGDDGLTVEVTDTGAVRPVGTTGSGGHGVLGMRERAALLGGTCEAGPRTDGPGWRVRAVLPLSGDQAPVDPLVQPA